MASKQQKSRRVDKEEWNRKGSTFVPRSKTGMSAIANEVPRTTDSAKQQSHQEFVSLGHVSSSSDAPSNSTVQGEKPCLKVKPLSYSSSDDDSGDQGYEMMAFPAGVVTQLSKVSVGDYVRDQLSHVSNKPKELNISPQEVNLLKCESVMLDLLSELMKNEVVIDAGKISQGKIIVKMGDTDTLLNVLKSVIIRVSLEADDNDQEVLASLQSLKSRFTQQFEFARDRHTNTYIIMLHRKIQFNVLPEIHKLKTIFLTFPVSSYVMNYLKRYWNSIFKELKSRVQGIVEITLSDDFSNILMTCERKPFTVAKRALEDMVQNVKFSKTEIDPIKALYLQGIRGQAYIQTVKEEHQCRVFVTSPEQRLLMHVTVPGGHELLVYEGNMAAADCQALVLPLCQGQTHWSESERHILERGYLTSNLRRYAADLMPVRKHLTKTLQCQGLEGQTVVVMSVPGAEVDTVMDQCIAACTEALSTTSSSATSIAFPVSLSKDIPVDVSLLAIISAVKDRWNKGPPSMSVLLYFEKMSDELLLQVPAIFDQNLPSSLSHDVDVDNSIHTCPQPMMYLCGQKEDVEKALKEMTDMPVPEEYTLRTHAVFDLITSDDTCTNRTDGKDREAAIKKQPICPSDVEIKLHETQAFQAKVTIEPTIAAMRNKLSGDYILSVAQTSLQLLDPKSTNCVCQWPYNYIRRFGHTNCVFRMVVGRKCSTGEGEFAFLTLDREKLVNAVSKACQTLRSI